MEVFRKVSFHTISMLHKMRQNVIFMNGVFSAKIKTLAAALWSVRVRCEPCLKYYVCKAKELEATKTK